MPAPPGPSAAHRAPGSALRARRPPSWGPRRRAAKFANNTGKREKPPELPAQRPGASSNSRPRQTSASSWSAQVARLGRRGGAGAQRPGQLAAPPRPARLLPPCAGLGRAQPAAVSSAAARGSPPPRRPAAGSRALRGPIPPRPQPSPRGAQRRVPPASPASPGTARLARGAQRAATLSGSPARLSSPSFCLASNFASRCPLRRRPFSRRSPGWSLEPRGRRGYGKFGDWREKGVGCPRRGARGASSLPFMVLSCILGPFSFACSGS
ncbi:uncharacterized protein LOC111522957 [Piliocolobus tephrosceles]|uniref:uncharacterized protein LOC111522957 n=1 Tax=Piliocolobus tephrosceles TaxID=591936 RepID=UPI000C29F01B|nr:uncharacterized protein LOC111522957 [Piliocolobus tephrosceles]